MNETSYQGFPSLFSWFEIFLIKKKKSGRFNTMIAKAGSKYEARNNVQMTVTNNIHDKTDINS